ncbi:type II secretion system protein [Fervidobacterium thailandense]|uniref:Type II secretion system protein n=1 Tax=Fervidobacterium thailandense TaxID=1008305 RepID=A0A1E3G2V5_9BACT|nr:type II secretion system protein [Fervidobacterium thailandense]ODN30480.1 hypothetical protein A4H02_05485 [Fervidobacterium thailandense]
MKRGITLVEALISILIISMAIGIATLSVSRLMSAVYGNSKLVELSEILFNTCEELVYQDVSRIQEGSREIVYNGKKYVIRVRKEVLTPQYVFKRGDSIVAKPPELRTEPVTKVIVTVLDDQNRFVTAEIIPKQ